MKRTAGRYSLVDGIPFQLPVRGSESPVFFAVFPMNADKAKEVLPGHEVHPLKLWQKGLLVVTVIDYRKTNIGKYIEYSIGIACTHGEKPAPALLPGVFLKHYGTGQFVYDLPVSTEVSVKGGKGIWGMPKHRASLDYKISDTKISSQYDLDGELATYVEIERPQRLKSLDLRKRELNGPAGIFMKLCVYLGAVNYCAFRGLLYKSYIYFRGSIGFALGKQARGRLVIGDHPRLAPLKELEIETDNPLFTAFIPEMNGDLDDHFECWFLSDETPPTEPMEGLESVATLSNSEEWPPPPTAPIPD